METRASYLMVGGFVLALMLGLVVFLAWLSNDRLHQARTTYYIYFSGSVTGLQAGSQVLYRGIPVGTVSDVVIDPQNIQLVRATVDVREGTPIKTDSVASIELQGITGGVYVQISGGTQSSPMLSAKGGQVPVIQSQPSYLEDVIQQLPRLVGNLTRLTRQAREFVNPANAQAFSDLLHNAETMTVRLNQSADRLDETLGALATVGQDADGLVRDLDKTTKTLTAEGAGTLRSYRAVAGDLRTLTRSLGQTSGQIDAMVRENRGPVRDFTTNGLYQFTELTKELRILTQTLQRLTTRFEQSPTNFLFGGSNQGVQVK